VGKAAAQAACRQRTQVRRLLAGARAERTVNMFCMDVTLVVSKLSGWLNADACSYCRVERESIKRAATGGPRGGRVWARRRRKQGAGRGPKSAEAAGRGTRGAHLKHVLHGRDAGRVEAQRLVERRRPLPIRKGKHKKSGDRRAGTREGVGAAAARAACRQRTQLWRLLAGARAERTSNMLLMVVTPDVSQLSGWLNACAYCRVERESINRAATGGPGGGRAWARRRRKQRAAGRGPRLWRLLAGARAERTQNMESMVVTLDVSQLSGWLNADAYCRVERESMKRAATGEPGGGRAWARRRRKQRAGRGPDCGGGWQGHARSAR
jgi:hypothetical protein